MDGHGTDDRAEHVEKEVRVGPAREVPGEVEDDHGVRVRERERAHAVGVGEETQRRGRREDLGRVGVKGHDGKGHAAAKGVRASGVDDGPMSQVQAVEGADHAHEVAVGAELAARGAIHASAGEQLGHAEAGVREERGPHDVARLGLADRERDLRKHVDHARTPMIPWGKLTLQARRSPAHSQMP